MSYAVGAVPGGRHHRPVGWSSSRSTRTVAPTRPPAPNELLAPNPLFLAADVLVDDDTLLSDGDGAVPLAGPSRCIRGELAEFEQMPFPGERGVRGVRGGGARGPGLRRARRLRPGRGLRRVRQPDLRQGEDDEFPFWALSMIVLYLAAVGAGALAVRRLRTPASERDDERATTTDLQVLLGKVARRLRLAWGLATGSALAPLADGRGTRPRALRLPGAGVRGPSRGARRGAAGARRHRGGGRRWRCGCRSRWRPEPPTAACTPRTPSSPPSRSASRPAPAAHAPRRPPGRGPRFGRHRRRMPSRCARRRRRLVGGGRRWRPRRWAWRSLPTTRTTCWPSGPPSRQAIDEIAEELRDEADGAGRGPGGHRGRAGRGRGAAAAGRGARGRRARSRRPSRRWPRREAELRARGRAPPWSRSEPRPSGLERSLAAEPLPGATAEQTASEQLECGGRGARRGVARRASRGAGRAARGAGRGPGRGEPGAGRGAGRGRRRPGGRRRRRRPRRRSARPPRRRPPPSTAVEAQDAAGDCGRPGGRRRRAPRRGRRGPGRRPRRRPRRRSRPRSGRRPGPGPGPGPRPGPGPGPGPRPGSGARPGSGPGSGQRQRRRATSAAPTARPAAARAARADPTAAATTRRSASTLSGDEAVVYDPGDIARRRAASRQRRPGHRPSAGQRRHRARAGARVPLADIAAGGARPGRTDARPQPRSRRRSRPWCAPTSTTSAREDHGDRRRPGSDDVARRLRPDGQGHRGRDRQGHRRPDRPGAHRPGLPAVRGPRPAGGRARPGQDHAAQDARRQPSTSTSPASSSRPT